MFKLVNLNESALRTPEFTEGATVTLADGQVWTFPKPTPMFRPTFENGIAISIAMMPTFGPKVDRYIHAMRDDKLEDDGLGYAQLRFTAAAMLLLKNYNLDDEALGQLLVVNFADPEIQAMWVAIDRISFHLPDNAVNESPAE